MIENVSTQLTVFHCFAHCLLPGWAFASLYALLFLGKEAEIGGRVGEQGKMAFISGEQRKKGQILRATETKLGNREYKKTKFEGTEEQANLFQRNKETCIPHLRGLRISLRRQNTTEVMTYNIT